MSSFIKLTWVDFKLYLRNWIATFFTLVFPVMMLFLFGSMYGNNPTPIFNGRGSVDVSVPGYIVAIVIGTTAFMSLPLEMVSRREKGVLRRLRATPLSPLSVLGSQVAVNLGMSILGAVLLILPGVLVYKIHLPANPLPVLAGFGLSCLSLFALGFLIAALVKTISAARAITMVIFYPMMFLSGGTLPLQFMPQAVQNFSRFLPVTQAVNLLKDLWFGQGWNLTAVIVLVGLMLVSATLAARLFQWD